MSIFSAIGRLAHEYQAARARYLTERQIQLAAVRDPEGYRLAGRLSSASLRALASVPGLESKLIV